MAEWPSENIAPFLEKVSGTFGFDGNSNTFMEGEHFFKIKPIPKLLIKNFLLKEKKLAERVVFISVSFNLS